MENDGGPAFPTPESHGDDFEGMSLRDYFASAALQGLIIGLHNPATVDANQKAKQAAAAYEYADAMLAKRLK